MPNDTTTLNGALRQLGETMAANLTTQGVPSTYDEGLTTLAGKILDIQGGGGTRTLTLTADKSILSYYDSDTATLSATLLEDGEPVTGEAVVFFNGSTPMGSAQTDSNGVATKIYTSAGVGDVEFTAKADNGTLVSETYSIQDYHYYSTVEYSTPSDDGTSLNIPLPSAFQLEFDITPTSRSTSGWGSSGYIRIGADKNTGLWIGQLTSAGRHGLMPKPSGTTQYCTSNSVLDTDNHITVSFNGVTAQYTCNNESVSLSASNLSKIVSVSPTSNVHVKNIKVKPL